MMNHLWPLEEDVFGCVYSEGLVLLCCDGVAEL